MKKLFFMLIAVLSVALTSCSSFDSIPIEPNVIGCGSLHYDVKSGFWLVTIDSTQYAISNLTVPDNTSRSLGKTQNTEPPVEGMMVTAFTSPRKTGIQAVAGKYTAEEIEELYRKNNAFDFVLCAVFLVLCCVWMFWPEE